jgi:hypothetical protein
MTFISNNKVFVGSSSVSILCFIATFIIMGVNVFNADNKAIIGAQIRSVLGTALAATIFFSVAVGFFYKDNKETGWIVLIILSTLAIGLSYSALCIAAISANSLPS